METGPSLWIDERQRQLPPRPWRKIHYDFQIDAPSSDVGADFDADAFVATLRRAHVDGIVVFAKNTYGWCFYPSALGPVHPSLAEPDLLGKQVAACRAAGIKVYAYYAYAWDELVAAAHPEWLVWKRDRTTHLPPLGEQPMWSALCIAHPELLERAIAHTDEVLAHCEVDGMWYDMVYPIGGECFCWRCLQELREAGLDPLDRAVQRRRTGELHDALLRRLTDHVRAVRPDAQVDFNTQACIGLGERLDAIDNVDIEALPTGGWGYAYFPIHARYARTFGVSVYGMSGRFHKAWGDYGGLKHPTQLRTELAGIVALGVRCDIGDQALPGAQPDPATYATIGEAYAEIAQLEPWLEGAVAVSEAAIVVDGPPLSHLAALDPDDSVFPSTHAAGIGGMAKLLTERHIQFDVVETSAEIERYRLLVLPDSLAVDDALAARLNAHLAAGGAVIAAHRAVRLAPAEDELWPQALRGALRGPSPFQPAFTRLDGELAAQLPRYAGYEFALYGETDRWELAEGDGVAIDGRLSEATYQRWQEGWQSAPPAIRTDHATVVHAGRLAAFAFPLGASYFTHGYWFYRELLGRMLDRVLPEPLVRTSAPQSAEVTVTHQVAAAEHGERWIAHVVNYSPMRRSEGGIEYLEDPIPLHDVELALALDVPIARAYDARTGAELALERSGERWVATVPVVPVAATVVFEAQR
ncbi:MAG TPA: alpha-amylase family protein [Conexibacter sp.]|nr:alpha-amylase family protein [Conexibacter sp.]